MMSDAITINMDTTTGAITVTAPDGNEEVEMKIASLMGDMIATIIEEETGTRPAYRVLPSEVADEFEQLRAEIARLRAALRFYASEQNYQLETPTGHIRNESPVAEDNGSQAREALKRDTNKSAQGGDH
jgi:hypothetical protein